MAVEEERNGPRPANDNGSRSGQSLDPRILRIAVAIGRQLAREQVIRGCPGDIESPVPNPPKLKIGRKHAPCAAAGFATRGRGCSRNQGPHRT